ncbi:hypothetical protein DFR49_3720 [Hephaestia caeni]|uniref:Uncharacterized protein n=1 Tax=Hephaestia caeni TaxID=645617 RepID=A0A397NJW9_9SPHN|nr:hypothetical protein DFR49_3720 [Hephaestia caeni]
MRNHQEIRNLRLNRCPGAARKPWLGSVGMTPSCKSFRIVAQAIIRGHHEGCIRHRLPYAFGHRRGRPRTGRELRPPFTGRDADFGNRHDQTRRRRDFDRPATRGRRGRNRGMPSGMQTGGLGDRPATQAPFGEHVKHAADLDRAAALRGRPAERSPATRRGRQRCRPLFRVGARTVAEACSTADGKKYRVAAPTRQTSGQRAASWPRIAPLG